MRVFQTCQFHLERLDLPKRFSCLVLALLFDLALLRLVYLDGVHRVISSDLLHRLAAIDRLNGDTGLIQVCECCPCSLMGAPI